MTNRTSGVLVTAVGVALAGILSMSAIAQQKPAPPKTQWAATDLLPLTCAQAWASGQDLLEDALDRGDAGLSLARQSRPDVSRHARSRIGNRKANRRASKADPNDLLFAIIDKHVRQVAEAATSAGQ